MNSKISKIKKWIFEKHFGFLEDGSFCHGTKLSEFLSASDIKEGLGVEYIPEMGIKGQNVSRIIRILPEEDNIEVFMVANNNVRNINLQIDNYLIDTYCIDNSIDLKLISGDSKYKNNVKELAELLRKGGLTDVQIRRFYSEVLTLKDKDWKEIDLGLQLLMAKVAYAKGRKSVTNDFYKWFENRIQIIKNESDFRNFLLHYEALLAYFKCFPKKY